MKKNYVVAGVLIASLGLVQCTKETPEPDPVPPKTVTAITDQELLDMAKTTSGYTYYKNSNDITASSPQSGHNDFFRVRFNSIALAALTDNGKLPEGGTFPEGSVIVKELHKLQDGTEQTGLAVMIKRKGDPNASEKDWVWGEYFGGTTANAKMVTSKGTGCLSCHAGSKRDMVRVFELFP